MDNELDLLLHELFDTQPYTRHGVTLTDGMCVVDLGANLGLFSLWCTTHAKNLRILACEPVPVLAALARTNLAQVEGHTCTVLECGVSDRTADQTVRYYPRATACSTVYGAETEGRMPKLYSDTPIPLADLWSIHKGAFALGLLFWPVYPWLRRQVVGRVLRRALSRHHDYRCRFTTLSALIDTHELAQIDLLKIDVQGCEALVLDGVRDAHWPRIRAIAMEVNTFLGPQPSPDLLGRLDALGFQTTRDAEPPIAAPGSYFLYAVRP